MNASRCFLVSLALVFVYGCSSGGSGPSPESLLSDADVDGEMVSEMSDDMAGELGGDMGLVNEADPQVSSEMPSEDSTGVLSTPETPATAEREALTENALFFSPGTRCSVVGEDLSFSVQARSADDVPEADADPTVNGFVTLVQSLGDSAELVSRSDEEIVLRITRPDIVAITAETQSSSITGYFSAIEADAPSSVIQRKVFSGGCLYSLRLPGYCATVITRNGEATIGRDGVFISVDGCELENRTDIPVRELPGLNG